MTEAIDNKALINGVMELKSRGIIKRDVEVADAMGYSKGTLSDYLNNRKQVSDSFLTKFYEKYPEAKIVRKGKKGKSELEQTAFGDKMLMHVPLVREYAYGGYMHGYGDAEYIDNLPTAPFIVDKEPRGTYIAFEVRGDSMNDGTAESILPGDIVLCREIKRDLWQSKLHIKKWDFVIAHRVKGIVLKRIINHNTTNGTVTLHSLNPEFEDFTAKLDDVVKLFNVVQVVRRK